MKKVGQKSSCYYGVHGQGKVTVEGSVERLKSYACSLGWTNTDAQAHVSAKGKETIWEGTRGATRLDENGDGSNAWAYWKPPGNGSMGED
jgi:hypothetical protein